MEPDANGNFELQILHASDLEAGVSTPEDAPRFSAVVNGLESEFPDQTLLLSSGDNYIPGPFLAAGADPSLEDEFGAVAQDEPDTPAADRVLGIPGQGRGDILLMNEIGFDASALGNHEFDLGSGFAASLVGEESEFQDDNDDGAPDDANGNGVPDVFSTYPGTNFPYLSANLEFADSTLADFVVEGGQAPQPNSLAESTVIEVNGESIGIVGATTPLLESISSPGDVTVLPDVTAEVQSAVDTLTEQGINKIILISHLQQLANEQDLAAELEGVDVVIAGGSDTRLADDTDRLRLGDEAEGPYPILTESASGEPVAIVSTDGNYSYVGRLVAEFDENGLLLPESIDPAVSGAYATDEEGVADTGNFDPNPDVVAIASAVGEVIAEQDGNTFGSTEVFLNGEREDVRTQETSLGNLSAEANLAAAQAVDDSVVVSIKNGGGIRASIGAIDPETGERIPPVANEAADKEAGDVSQLDIANSLRFNNELSLLTLTAEQLLATIEHGVAATEPGATPGQFSQVAGLAFSFDPDLPTGNRVQSLAVQDADGNISDVVVEDGELVGDPNREFRTVTLNFLADGGDNYPFPQFQEENPDRANRVDLTALDLEAGTATFADPGTEQDALAEYLAENFAEQPFDNADVPPVEDERIQNLNERRDTVLSAAPTDPSSSTEIALAPIGTYGTGVFDAGAAEIVDYDPESQRLFVVNANDASVDVLDASDPSEPTLVNTIDASSFGAGVNSLAVFGDVVAVAIENEDTQSPGTIAFFDTNGNAISSVTVGALPDMLTFTPDGQKVLVANEGEPSNDYSVDPEGSVSIIDVSGGIANLTQEDVRTAGFTAFDNQEELTEAGVRVFGPDASLAQDVEPEYITVSEDSTTAWVSLQESNALAKLDLAAGEITDILPLGLKDHNRNEQQLETFTFDDLPTLGTTEAGQDILLGGFSGLTFEGVSENGNLQFLTHFDQGPNATPLDSDGDGVEERPFALPDLQPEWIRFELDQSTGALTITDRIGLTRSDGTPLTGLTNLEGSPGLAHADESLTDLFGNPLELDPLGADFEGIVRDPDGTYWMVEEYRPSIYHFDAAGQLIDRFVPEGSNATGVNTGTEALPAVYAQRRANRGFEAVAYQDGKIYAFVQSPLDNPDVADDANFENSASVRILEFDTATNTTTGEYLYRLEGGDSDRIGDAVSLENGEFLVIERDADTGPDALKRVFRIDLTEATNLSTLDPSIVGPGGSLESLTADQLATQGIEPVSKELEVDLIDVGYDFGDKPEGLAVVDENTIAVLNDDDFRLAGGVDLETGLLEDNPEPFEPVLGLINIDGSGLDASDEDGEINIDNWPVQGMYQPDAIASYEVNGETFLITANEGDSRDYEGFNEEARVADLELDPTVFPNAAALQAEEALGNLTVTTANGDTDGDGDFDQLNAFGGRSFSIRDTQGNLVYDSGDDFEQITAALLPENFNSDNSENDSFDSRSDDKGPEPEGVTTGVIGDRTYAFIGLERIGGVMTYDVTDPTHPTFVQYINNRDFSVEFDPEAAAAGESDAWRAAGDLGPEGLTFIAAEDSPNGNPLLVTGNEVSGTTSIFEISNILSGSDGRNTFAVSRDNGTVTITDFGGVGTGVNPSPTAIAEADILQFPGEKLTTEKMLLTQDSDLVITFEGSQGIQARLRDFDLEDMDNLQQATGVSVDIGNIVFDEQTEAQDRFDVFNVGQQRQRIFNRDSVTFLNDLNNDIKGFAGSSDVINGQGGNDNLAGLGGDDILRGGDGEDTLTGGSGRDQFWIVSSGLQRGTDTITDFEVGTDVIGIASLPGVSGIGDLDISQTGADTLITALDQNLAILKGIEASTINSSFAFA